MANKRIMGHDSDGNLVDLTPHVCVDEAYHLFDRETQQEMEARALDIARSLGTSKTDKRDEK